LAYAVDEICIIRYENNSGKSDHRHWGEGESDYEFVSQDKLLADFRADIARWNHENCHS
jgi:hypothetical protein